MLKFEKCSSNSGRRKMVEIIKSLCIPTAPENEMEIIRRSAMLSAVHQNWVIGSLLLAVQNKISNYWVLVQLSDRVGQEQGSKYT